MPRPSRQPIKLHRKSHLIRQEQKRKSQLLQCSTSMFFLTSFYELTHEAIVNTTALLLGIPMPHARFLKLQGGQYANIDTWGYFLLNNSAQAGDTHNKMARELAKIANECGISTTCT